MKHRKKKAMRLYARILLTGRIPYGRSEGPPGRSAAELWTYLQRLKKLLHNDPNNAFWIVLQKALLKALKYLDATKQ